MKKNNHFQKQLKFHCPICQVLYQLMEVHSQVSSNCSNDCLTKWQAICHEYYQEKVLGYIHQQGQEEVKEDSLAEQFAKIAKQSKK